MSKPRFSGIYRIRHVESGRCYVGSASNIYERWCSHRGRLNKGSHHCRHLQFAWTKHGPDAFSFEVIEKCFNEKVSLVAREQHYIDKQLSKGRRFLYNSSIESIPGHDVGGKARITDLEVQDVFRRFAAGETIESIAESLSTSDCYIYRILWRRTRKRVPLDNALEQQVRLLLEEQVFSTKRMGRRLASKAALEIYRRLAEGEEPAAIAVEYKISTSAAYMMRNAEGHKELLAEHPSLRSKLLSLPPMCRRRFKESEVMEIAAMYADGVSMIEITSAFRCFPEAVQAIASRRSYTHVVISDEITRRCAFRANPGKPGELNINAKLTPDQAREIDRLRRSGMTLSEIAKRFDVSISTVHRISRGEQYACATSEQQMGHSVDQIRQLE